MNADNLLRDIHSFIKIPAVSAPWEKPDSPVRTKSVCTEMLAAMLTQAAVEKKVCTLFAPSGSGKTALLGFWRQCYEGKTIPAKGIVYITLRGAINAKEPLACVVLSQLWYRLQQLAAPSYLPQRTIVDWKEIKTCNERQLVALETRMIVLAEQLNIRAIVIDDAHHLDSHTLGLVLGFRKYYHPDHEFITRRALILSAKKEDEDRKHRLTELLEDRKDIQKDWTKIETRYLSRDEFIVVFAWIVKQNLAADFDSQFHLTQAAIEAWKLIGEVGNWWQIGVLTTHLDKLLTDATNGRVLTPEILDRLKATMGQARR